MKSLTEYLTFEVKTRRAFVNITSDVSKLVTKSKIQEGLCLVNAMHITASVLVIINYLPPTYNQAIMRKYLHLCCCISIPSL